MKSIASSIAIAAALPLAGGAYAHQPPQQQRAAALFANAPQFDPSIEVGFAVLNVGDMKKMRAYYEMLGLTVTATATAHNGIPGTPENKNMPMVVFQTAAGSGASGLFLAQSDGPVVLGNGWNRLGIRVVDAAGVCKRLAAAGTPCLREPRGTGPIAVAWAKDPEGRLLELVEYKAN